MTQLQPKPEKFLRGPKTPQHSHTKRRHNLFGTTTSQGVAPSDHRQGSLRRRSTEKAKGKVAAYPMPPAQEQDRQTQPERLYNNRRKPAAVHAVKNCRHSRNSHRRKPIESSTNAYPAQCRMKEGRTKTLLKAKSENLRCSKDTANPTDKRMPHPHRITMHPHWKHHTTQAHNGVRLAAKRSQSQPPQAKP